MNGGLLKRTSGWAGTPEAIKISKYSTANGGVADAATGVANAIQAAIDDGSYLVHTGSRTDLWYVSSFSNIYGVEFTGAGSILVATSQSGYPRKIYPNNDRFQTVIGREYLSHFHKRIIAGSANTIVCSGDSLTQGTLLTAPYVISTALPAMATKYGIAGVTGVNVGHSGLDTNDWITTYLSADLATNPNLYLIEWGINDDNPTDATVPHTQLTFAQTVANYRSGLATIRASKTVSNMSVLIWGLPSTNSVVRKPNLDKYYWRLNLALKQAARDYQCTYVDVNTPLWDTLNASDWMDDSYNTATYGFATDVGHVHPDDVKQMWINSIISDVIYPTMLRTNG